jgi:hypothetical protein
MRLWQAFPCMRSSASDDFSISNESEILMLLAGPITAADFPTYDNGYLCIAEVARAVNDTVRENVQELAKNRGMTAQDSAFVKIFEFLERAQGQEGEFLMRLEGEQILALVVRFKETISIENGRTNTQLDTETVQFAPFDSGVLKALMQEDPSLHFDASFDDVFNRFGVDAAAVGIDVGEALAA